jgi:hypothetical protein
MINWPPRFRSLLPVFVKGKNFHNKVQYFTLFRYRNDFLPTKNKKCPIGSVIIGLTDLDPYRTFSGLRIRSPYFSALILQKLICISIFGHQNPGSRSALKPMLIGNT